jgi:hypothetical protein
MPTYSREQIHKKVAEILDQPAEHTCSYQEIKDLAELFRLAQENGDSVTVQELLWERDLLCPVLEHKCQHEGKEVQELTQKWEFYLERGDGFTEPLSNEPFCQWTKETAPYYLRRLEEANSAFAKARYAFALMTLSSGKDRYRLAKESFDCWVKTGEEYVKRGDAVGAYEIVPLAYGLAIRTALEFGQPQWALVAVESLSRSIDEAIAADWRGWLLDLFWLFSNNLESLKRSEKNRRQLEITRSKMISQLKELIEKSEGVGEYHLARCYLDCLADLVDAGESYALMKRAAEMHIREGDNAQEGLVRYTFFERGLKAYKDIQDRFPERRDEVEARIREIALAMKEQSGKIQWETISSSVPIEDPIRNYIEELKEVEHGVLNRILENRTCLMDLKSARDMALEQKENAPLSFIFPHSIHNDEGAIREHRSDEALMDYKARCNVTLSIGFFEIMVSKAMLEMHDKIVKDGDITNLLSEPRISDIRPALNGGLEAMMKSPPDHLIAAHMLTPYVEELIRRIILANGMEDRLAEWERQAGTGEKTLSYRKIELGGLLVKAEVQAILGSSFSDSLRCFLIDQDQINFRNRLLHGLLPSAEIKVMDTYFLTYTVLKLILILTKLPESPVTTGEAG